MGPSSMKSGKTDGDEKEEELVAIKIIAHEENKKDSWVSEMMASCKAIAIQQGSRLRIAPWLT